ncbi:MAG: transglutaminase family protein [Micropruina sp.]|nr:MAG: transglutaminase family protein [Micropruina sp.]
MTRQLRITHHTGYSYEGMVSASHNEVRMTPRSSREQFVVSSRIDIVPKPWLLGYQDYWRTWVTAFEIREPHQRLDVTATSVVDVSRGLADVPGLTWDQLRDPRLADKHFEMLQVSDHVDPGRVLRTFAAETAREAERPAQAVAAVIGRIREHVSYVPGSTHVRTRAADAWEAGAGVCQDMVHLALGALRGMGVPARYVSGYVMPCANPVVGQPRTGSPTPGSSTGTAHGWDWIPPTTRHPGNCTSRWAWAATTATSRRCGACSPGRGVGAVRRGGDDRPGLSRRSPVGRTGTRFR